jgi:ADP-ribose pyrophosphatase YjhB (NUDIX family)
MSARPRIQTQIKLPLRVALEVVWQGIRIRLGRSIVTMTGVVLGVAFLMSVLSSNAFRRGLAEETQQRQEVQRMLRFLESETGPLRGRIISVWINGDQRALESRLLTRLQRENPAELRLYAPGTPPQVARATRVTDPADLAPGSSGLIVMGEGPGPDVQDWSTFVAAMRQPVVAGWSDDWTAPDEVGLTAVPLSRPLRAEDVERAAERARQERARNMWIVTIALLVTVIGITNALLMSVTERFKEIGTMKCLGAMSLFIRQVFFIESALTGLIGSLTGGVLGFLIAYVLYGLTFGFGLVSAAITPDPLGVAYLVSVVGGVSMSIIAAIYPASFASRMVPATALRSNI